LRYHYRSDEPIAATGDGVDETGLLGVVAKGLTDFADGSIDAVLGIDKDFAIPEAFHDFRARYRITFAGGEKDEKFHRLALELENAPPPG
jgi:hypothetical protein